MWSRRVLAVVIVIAGAAAMLWVAPWRDPGPPAPVLDEDELPRDVGALDAAAAPRTIDELRTRIAAVLEREGVPGAGIALVGKDGPIWIGGVGMADVKTRRPVDGDTVFRVGSISKMFVTLGVMRLVDAGLLSIDRPLREIVPDAGVTNAWEDTAPVTLAQAMEHTAGFDDMRFNEMFTDDDELPVAAALALNPRSRVTRWPPGTRQAYTNVGFTVAGRAIEVVTGERFDTWLHREVIAPLGMRDADFHLTPALAAHLATGYLQPGSPAGYHALAHRPSGALMLSPRELGKLLEFWIRRGEGFPPIISRASMDRIERSGTLPYAPTDSSYGLANYGDVGHPIFARGHDGAMPGYLTSLRYFPQLGAGYVIMLNGTFSGDAFRDLRRLAFAYLAARGAPPAQVTTTTTAAPSPEPPGAKFFAFAGPRHSLFAFVDRALFGWHVVPLPGGLRVDPLWGESDELVPAHDGAYAFRGASGSSVRFARAADGTPVMLSPFGYGEAASPWWSTLRFKAIAIAWCLLELAPVWLAIVVALGVARGRRIEALDLAVWPALSAASLFAFPHLLHGGADHYALGEINAWTLGLWAATVMHAIAALAGLVSALLWLRRPGRWSLLRVVPTACALAAAGFALWLGANGIVGLRAWSY